MELPIEEKYGGEYVCTSCGYIGESRTITKGSFLIEIILWLFFLIPGLIYSIWRLTTRHTACPQCGNPTMIPVDTPKGQELIKLYSKSDKSEQNQVKESLTQKHVKRSPWKAIIVFILLPLALLSLVGLTSNNSNEQQTSPTKQPRKTSQLSKKEEVAGELIGKVNFSNGQFHITNEESEDWKSCWFQVNSKYKYPTNAPNIRLDIVKAGKTVSIGAEEFTLKDGTRYNPFSIKANNFSASCESGRFGYWSWNQ